ncbi:sugar fermentation stimulation protein A [Rhizobium azooxidifex]|uniref:Sugar fermentation stimulation protein homolog n=1 Tax=Mycoplana azooxidifex TaxID=1636188 RepID=A0A7W6D6L8_9HYPH|nr:DNA/RNA nuclease SfsA [Mycoplana azooxidifex]MBB3977736.1 sugar fermentation stimulation protein A [Mycoplana azooxidifex]
MIFAPPLVPATLVQRYKRFLFDAVLGDGTAITGSCPNTGSMRGLTAPGSRIWLSEHDGPLRKYRHRFELIEADGTVVGVNTGLPNRLAEEAIRAGLVSDLASYPVVERERKYGRNSRIDLLLSGDGRAPTYVEVKNVHFSRTRGLAEFPDTATARGAKHLEELGDVAEAGCRAVMLYVVQRGDCDRFRICRDLDPVYAIAFERARSRGVEAYAVGCTVSALEIRPDALIAMDETAIAAL